MSLDITNAVVNLGRADGGRQQLDELLRRLRRLITPLTQAQYDALAEKDPATLYTIVDDQNAIDAFWAALGIEP